jgi:carbon-monoxide dehydrogenase medium subunit
MASAEAKARPILGEVAAQIADVQVRNRGTIGGNVCSNDPTNHLPPLLVAIGAQFTIAGQAGERTVPAEEFFLGVYLTAVGPGELLTKITIPAGKHDGFAAVTLGVDGTCIVNAAASANGSLRVAIGCVDATPVLVHPASGDDDAVREAVRGANLFPPSDVHASAEYRTHLAEVLAVRAARQAQERS